MRPPEGKQQKEDSGYGASIFRVDSVAPRLPGTRDFHDDSAISAGVVS
jgi:hypothetical protein